MSIIDTTIIIADDITGANDTALQFFKKGYSAKILIDYKKDFSPIPNADVLAISTESRNIDKETAFHRVLNSTQQLKEIYNTDNFYKKIDSTLRGNTGLEILAMLEATQKDAMLVVPAYIDEKRTTIGGYQLLGGIPIERTQCAFDPKAPVYDSFIPNILKKDFNSQYEDLIDIIEFRTVSKGAGPITLKINELIANGKKIIIVDAVSNTDLEQIALAISKSSFDILPCGCAGLAEAISKKNNGNFEKRHIKNAPKYPVLMISGSATKLTYKQIQKLKQEKKEIFFVDLKVENIIRGIEEKLLFEIIEKLNSNTNVVIHCSDIKVEIKNEEAQNQLIEGAIAKDEFPSLVTDFISDLLKELNSKSNFILTLIGGETSYKCAKKINSGYLEILDSILPAIPLCIDMNGKIIATKSGNFGSEDTLIKILDYFENLKGANETI